MKANELMVGDIFESEDAYNVLVRSVADTAEKDFCIVEILDGVHQGEIQRAHCENLTPIPLTPEILEKNGWKITGCKDAKYYFHNDVSFCIPLFGLNRNKGRDVSKTKMYADDFFDSIMIRIHYVHELQHALKLCKIEKEIVL